MSRTRIDRYVGSALGFAALMVGSLVLVVVLFLVRGAWPALEGGQLIPLLTDEKWQPGSVRDPQFGVVAMFVGSLLVTVLAVGIAVPLGVAGAVFQVFYAPEWLGGWNRRALELLAGVPSVIFGFWGLTVLVPAINRLHPPGQSLLAAGVILALMILPTVALASQSALAGVPCSQLQAAAALGVGRAGTIWNIALRAARPGIVAGVLLGAARAVGETMAVVMVCGNIAQVPGSIFDPIRPVTATIALEMGYAVESHRALLFASGLVLVLLVGLLIVWQSFRRRDGQGSDALASRMG